MSPESRDLLAKFGSTSVKEFSTGQSFAMIGQRGLQAGKAIEQLAVINEKEQDGLSTLTGCLKFPCSFLLVVVVVVVVLYYQWCIYI